jgi:hypothetical protein
MPDLSFFLKPSGQNAMKEYGIKGTPDKKKIAVFPTDYVNPAIDRSSKEFGNKAYSFAENMARELDKLHEAGWEVYVMCCSTGGYGDDRIAGGRDDDTAILKRYDECPVMPRAQSGDVRFATGAPRFRLRFRPQPQPRESP